MSSKKRTWSKEEILKIANSKIISHESGSFSHNYLFDILIVVVIVLSISAYHQYFAVQGEWQPINCVNETINKEQIAVFCGESRIGFLNPNSTINISCTILRFKSEIIEVPTGRQICSQEVLVRNRTIIKRR